MPPAPSHACLPVPRIVHWLPGPRVSSNQRHAVENSNLAHQGRTWASLAQCKAQEAPGADSFSSPKSQDVEQSVPRSECQCHAGQQTRRRLSPYPKHACLQWLPPALVLLTPWCRLSTCCILSSGSVQGGT